VFYYSLNEAVNSEQVDGLGRLVVSKSLSITEVECGDSIFMWLSGVAVTAGIWKRLNGFKNNSYGRWFLFTSNLYL
jgi:hypothetical protein